MKTLMLVATCWCGLAGLVLAGTTEHTLPTGEDAKRPYEMVWANRTQDHTTPLLALTDAAGWTVETHHAEASLARATGAQPSVTLKPPDPVPVKGGFDTISCWVYGEAAYYMHNHAPVTNLRALFRDPVGKTSPSISCASTSTNGTSGGDV